MDVLPPPGGVQPEPTPAQPPQPAQPAQPAGELLDPFGQQKGFLERLVESRATIAFMVAILAVFALCANDQGSVKAPFSEAVYQKFGGFHYKLVRDDGQWWRFLSGLFVPRWGLDMLISLWLLFELGPVLEKMLGSLRFSLLYLLAGASGIAVGELFFQPGQAPAGTMVAIYALLGGLPGAILGLTGSLAKTAANPGARSAVFWLALWLGIHYFWSGAYWSFEGCLGASLVAFLLAAGFGGWKRDPKKSVVQSAVPVALSVVLIGLVYAGKRWENGGLVDRGRPSTRGERDPASPTGTPEPNRPTGAEAAESLRIRFSAHLDKYGPLPSPEGLSDAEFEKILKVQRKLEEAVEEDNEITSELDDLRIRCHLLLAQPSEASRLAEEYLVMKPSPEARALAGAVHFWNGGSRNGEFHLEKAEDYLSSVLDERPELEPEQPAIRYYLGATRARRGNDLEANKDFERFLEVVGSDEGSAPRHLVPLIQQAKVQLDRR